MAKHLNFSLGKDFYRRFFVLIKVFVPLLLTNNVKTLLFGMHVLCNESWQEIIKGINFIVLGMATIKSTCHFKHNNH